MPLTSSQRHAVVSLATRDDGQGRVRLATAASIVRRGYAYALDNHGLVRLTEAGWRFAETGEI